MLTKRSRRKGLRSAVISIAIVAVFLLNATPAGAVSNCPATMVPCRQAWLANFTDTAPVYGTGDFNGDRAEDLLVLQDGVLWFWYGSPSQVPVIVPLSAIRVVHSGEMQKQLAGTEPVVGDFDGDARADVLWASQAGAPVDNGQIWFGTPSIGEFEGGPAAGTAHDGAATATVGDFDADGSDDLVWYGEATGGVLLQFLQGGRSGLQAVSYPDTVEPRLRLVQGDFDANRVEDLLFYNERSGLGAAWFFERGGGIDARSFNPGRGFRVNAGDFDGDSRDDLLWYGPGEAVDAFWFGTADRAFRGAPIAAPVGGNKFPVVADMDGDQRADVFWWDGGPAADELWLTRNDVPYVIGQSLGAATQLAMADIDGDGGTDLLFFGMRDESGPATNWALWWMTSAPAR